MSAGTGSGGKPSLPVHMDAFQEKPVSALTRTVNGQPRTPLCTSFFSGATVVPRP